MNKEERSVFNKEKFIVDIETHASGLYAKLQSDLKSKIKNEVSSDVNANLDNMIEEFKSKINIFDSNLNKIDNSIFPKEVYKVVMQRFIAVEAPNFSDINGEGKLIESIATYINDILNPRTATITVKGENYKISNPLGQTSSLATITFKNKNYTLNWFDTKNTKKTFNDFFKKIVTLGKNSLSTEICIALITDTTHGLVDMLIDALSNAKLGVAKDIFEELKDYIESERDSFDAAEQAISKIFDAVDKGNNALKSLSDLIEKIFSKTLSNLIKNSTNKYQKFVEYKEQLLEDLLDGKEITNLKSLKNFINAYNDVSSTLEAGITLSDTWANGYYSRYLLISGVHNDVIIDANASIVATESADKININGDNSTILGNGGNDEIIINGNKTFVDGGYGLDTIIANGSDITLEGGGAFDFLPVKDTFIIGTNAKNVFIKNFETFADTIFLESTNIANEIQTYKDNIKGEDSLVISSSKTGDKIAIILGVTEGSINNISYVSDDGNTITSSIDWLLANKSISPPDISVLYKNISGTSQSDVINNAQSNIIIDAFDGDDIIYNSGNNVTIDGGKGNDLMFLTENNLKVNIKNNEGNDTILCSNGNDSIYNNGNNILIDSSEGDDYIKSNGDSINIISNAGADVINFDGKNVTIDSGSGDDTIKTIEVIVNAHVIDGDINASIDGGSGDDYITINNANSFVNGGEGNDSIYLRSGSKNSTIIGGNGDDTIHNDYASGTTIYAGVGNDVIYNGYYTDDVLIYAGDGDDSVKVLGYTKNVTVDLGTGNDYIHSSGSNILIYTGDGKNNIFNDSDLAKIYCGKDDDSIYNRSDNATIISDDGNDSIESRSGSYSSINTGNGNDCITVCASGVNGDNSEYITIDAGAGDDYTYVLGSYHILINGVSGKNTIDNYSESSTINGGIDDDLIYDHERYCTINAGKGNDTITYDPFFNSYGGSAFLYADGDGNDTIWGYSYNRVINIISGSYTTISNNNDVIIKVGGGSITLKDTKNLALNIIGTKGNNDTTPPDILDNNKYISNSSNYIVIAGTSGDDTIDSYGSYTTINSESGNDSIDNRNSSNSIVNADDGDDFISSAGKYNTLNGGAGNDTINGWTSNMFINGGDGNDSLYTGNYETNVTVFGGVGDDNIISWNSKTLLNGGKGNDTINAYGSSATISYANGDGNDIVYGYDKTDTLKIANNTFSTQNNGDDVIVKVGTGSIKLKDAKNIKLNIIGDKIDTVSSDLKYNIDKTAVTLLSSYSGTLKSTDYYSTVKNIDASRVTKGIKIIGNDKANSIKSGKGADTLTGGKGNDIFIYSSDDGNDVITDYTAGQDKIKITGGKITKTSVNGSDVILTVGSGNIKITNGKGKKLSLYNNSNSLTTTVIGGSSKTITVNNSTKSPITVSADIITIDARKRTNAVKITGNSLANTIYGGKGNDTLTGGSGNDVFVYANGSGKDTITDYTAGKDKIKITGAKISKTSVRGSDVILNIGSGSINIKNGKGKKLSIYNNATNLTTTVIGGSSSSISSGSTSTILTVTNSTKSPVTTGSTIKTVNASSRTSAIKITGNSLANSIVGGKGSDTLIGGKGNDTLTGGNSNDVFIYSNGDGNDVITDYSASDKISLSSSSSYSTTTSGQDVIVNIGNGSIKLKSAKNKKLNITGGKKMSTTSGGSSISTIPNDFTTVTVDNSHSMNNYKNKILINGTSSSDEIYNYGNNVIINGDAGNDFIASFDDGKNITLQGGAGSDTIYSFSQNSSINGGKGNDTIYIYENNSVIQYAEGDGDDVIYNWSDSDYKIQISGSYSTMNSGDDVVIKIGSGKMTLKYAKGNVLNINTSKNYVERFWFETDDNFTNDEITAITQQDITSYDKCDNSTGQLIDYDTNNILLNNQQVTSSLVYNRKK